MHHKFKLASKRSGLLALIPCPKRIANVDTDTACLEIDSRPGRKTKLHAIHRSGI